MKITNRDLVTSGPALEMLGNLHLPVLVSMPLAKILRQAKTAGQDFEAVRVKLVEKHARKDAAGKAIEVRNPQNGQMEAVFSGPKLGSDGIAVVPEVIEDSRPAFDAELKVLMDGAVDIAGEPIKIDALGNLNLPGNVLAALHWLVVE